MQIQHSRIQKVSLLSCGRCYEPAMFPASIFHCAGLHPDQVPLLLTLTRIGLNEIDEFEDYVRNNEAVCYYYDQRFNLCKEEIEISIQ